MTIDFRSALQAWTMIIDGVIDLLLFTEIDPWTSTHYTRQSPT